MKTVLKSLGLCLFLCGITLKASLGPFGFLVDKKEWEAPQTFSKQVEKTIEDLEKRKNEADELQRDYKTALEGVQKNFVSFKERLGKVRGVEHTYISALATNAQKTIQVLQEMAQIHQEYKKSLESHIKLLQENKLDPEFKSKGLQIPLKSIYSIDDLQKTMGAYLAAETDLRVLEERLEKISVDSETLEKNRGRILQELEDKKKEQKLLKSAETQEGDELRGLSIKQKGAILDAEVRLAEYRKDLVELKLREAAARAHFVQEQIRVNSIQRDILKEERARIIQELRVEKKELLASAKALKMLVDESNRTQDSYAKKISALDALRKAEFDEIATLKRRYSLSDQDMEAIYNWTYEPRTVGQWQALITIGQRHNQSVIEVEIHKDLWLARIEQEKAKVVDQEVDNAITNTWYTLTSRDASGGDAQKNFLKERKRYESMKADIESTISTLVDKQIKASQALTSNKRLLDQIQNYMKRFKEQESGLFKNKQEMHASLGQILKDQVLLETEKRGEVIAQLIDVYTTTIASLKMSSKKVDTMLGILKSKANWTGAPLFWTGLKSFIPDMTK
ncbi:hypothetical protein H0W26_04980, partial [Candidatus Dependentiae bacterium]|nr:hypothetical protein [Candidatus Dependentiae bacterium]